MILLVNMETRLDLEMVERNLVPSRSKASDLIKDGKVKVNGKVVLKSSSSVTELDIVEVMENDYLKYVSRGGLKLEHVINIFNVDFTGKVVLDIGASTGGFTDCALKHGARKVYSLDVGSNQLHESLLKNEKVISIENTNFKNVEMSLFDETIDLYVCDVSFISIETILNKLVELDDNFTIIILYKPQFEVGKSNLNSNGVVKNKNSLISSINGFLDFLKIKNIGVLDVTYSPILGHKEGNIEFLFYLKKGNYSKSIDVERIVNLAYKVLKVK